MCVCLQLTWEVGLPSLLWSFPPSALTSFPTPGCWACVAAPAFSSQVQLVYLQFREGFPSPTLVLRAPHPLRNVSLLFFLLITQFLFFSWVAVQSVQGAMLIWPRVVCGSTTYHLAHLVRVFPSHLGTGVWRPGGPPGFSTQCEVEMLCAGWRCGGVEFCLFLVALPARCVSSISPRFHFRRHAFCFLSLASILESLCKNPLSI
jgi:hypothetical protein